VRSVALTFFTRIVLDEPLGMRTLIEGSNGKAVPVAR
jgi:hypothetical protein